MGTVNRGSVLTVEYFQAYLRLICTSRRMSVAEAAQYMINQFFGGDRHRFGEQTFERFQQAIILIEKENQNSA